MSYEHTPSDKVQVRDIGSLQAPGTCALCGSGNCEEGYVDTGVWVDYFGNVYYCITCMEQITSVLGHLTKAEAQQLTDTSNELLAANRALTEENEALRVYKSKFDDLLVSAFGDSLDLDFSVGEGSNQPVGETSSVSEQPVNESDAGESEPAESVKGSGPAGTKRTKRRHSPDTGFTV